MRKALLMLVTVALAGAGCNRAPSGGVAGGTGLIDRFGSYPLAGSPLELEISKREASLVDFKVTRGPKGPVLLSDNLGSDAMRWFMVWEAPDVLWVHGSDTGYFKRFEFPAGVSSPVVTVVSKGMPVPARVRQALPERMRTSHPLRP